jgi:hypothetical protein
MSNANNPNQPQLVPNQPMPNPLTDNINQTIRQRLNMPFYSIIIDTITLDQIVQQNANGLNLFDNNKTVNQVRQMSRNTLEQLLNTERSNNSQFATRLANSRIDFVESNGHHNWYNNFIEQFNQFVNQHLPPNPAPNPIPNQNADPNADPMPNPNPVPGPAQNPNQIQGPAQNPNQIQGPAQNPNPNPNPNPISPNVQNILQTQMDRLNGLLVVGAGVAGIPGIMVRPVIEPNVDRVQQIQQVMNRAEIHATEHTNRTNTYIDMVVEYIRSKVKLELYNRLLQLRRVDAPEEFE